MRSLSDGATARRPAETGSADTLLRRPLLHLIDSRPLVMALGFLILAFGYYVYANAATANDIAWYLLATGKYLDGGKLYEDFVDINPPLIFFLHIPPVWFARLLNASQEHAFVIYVFGLTLISLGLIWLVTDSGKDGRRAHQGRVLTLAILLCLVILPTTDFGQREHLLLIFCVPYVLLTARRLNRRTVSLRLAIAIGAFAALGLALKPHFLALPLLLELYLTIRLGRFRLRPEALTAGLLIALYGLVVWLYVPTYFEHIIPTALLVYNSGYNSSLGDVVLRWQGLVLAILVALRLLTRWRPYNRALFDVCLIAAAALFAVHVVQMKSFYYHVMPASLMLLLCLTSVALAPHLRRVHQGIWPAAAVFAIAAILATSFARGTYYNPIAEPIRRAMQTYAKGSSVFVFSSYVWAGFPMTLEAGTRWPARAPCLWILPGTERQLQNTATTDPTLVRRLEDAETYMVDSVIEDFKKDPPALVIVDDNDRRFEGLTFNYLSFFARDPRFRELWRDYRPAGDICVGDFGPYRLYRRISALSPATSEALPQNDQSARHCSGDPSVSGGTLN
jgi:hypothetical protein